MIGPLPGAHSTWAPAAEMDCLGPRGHRLIMHGAQEMSGLTLLCCLHSSLPTQNASRELLLLNSTRQWYLYKDIISCYKYHFPLVSYIHE